MTSVSFHVNGANPRVDGVLPHLEAKARELALAVVEPSAADVVIVLGGDGTILDAVHKWKEKAILGFNLGGLGYLSSVDERNFGNALASLAHGEYRISKRAMLEVTSPDGARHLALNEIAVMRDMTGHTAVFDVSVDGKVVTRYMADGIIIATPTGSTAYSLSAGGSVVMPDCKAIAVTPMSPHALGARPIILNDEVKLAITPCARANRSVENISVAVDGNAFFKLKENEMITIAKAKATSNLVELEGYDPYEVLSRKLGWCGTSVK